MDNASMISFHFKCHNKTLAKLLFFSHSGFYIKKVTINSKSKCNNLAILLGRPSIVYCLKTRND